MFGLTLTLALTVGGAVAGLLAPFYGLLAYVSLAVLKPESLWYGSVPASNFSRVVALAMLVGWALRGFGDLRLGRARWVVFWLLMFLLSGCLSAAVAPDQALAWGFVEQIAKIVVPFLVGVTTIRSTTQLRQLAWTLLLCQGYVAVEMNRSYFSGYNRLQLEGFGGLDNNGVAIVLNAAVGLAFFLGLCERALWKRLVAWFLCLMMVHAIFFSFSRGGMFALCVTGGLSFFLIPKRTEHYLALAVALLIGVRLAGAEVTARFLSAFTGAETRDASASSRLDLWAACWQAMQEQPLFGLGPDHWQPNAHRYGFEKNKAAHSTWMEMGAELGFPGLVSLGMFYGSCIVGLWRFHRRTRREPHADPWAVPIGCMVVSSLVGFTVSAQFVTVEAVELPYYVVLLGAGALKIYSRPTETEDEFDQRTAKDLTDSDPSGVYHG
jgi:probable O-glycosylation ligase (exosortase A-associated)